MASVLDRSLSPCPFCAHGASIVQRGGPFWALCDNRFCFTKGPYGETAALAAKAWNRRPVKRDNPTKGTRDDG